MVLTNRLFRVLSFLRVNRRMSYSTPSSSATKVPTSACDSADTTLLSEEHKQHDVTESYRNHRMRQYMCLLVIFLAVVTLLAIPAGISSNNRRNLLRQNHYNYTFSGHSVTLTKSNNKPHPCGTSASEARSRNCTFDQLTWAWLPPSCTLYASTRFMSAEPKPWVYWQDLDRTQQVGAAEWEEVLNGERAILAERREHLTHCIFMYISLAQLLHAGGPYWEKLVQLEHHEHCGKMLLGELREGYGVSQSYSDTGGDRGMPQRNSREWEGLNSMIGGAVFDQDCEGNFVHIRG